MLPFPITIAIDGPAASGKTTVGKMLADQLGYLFLDTGCMYRAVTAAALQQDTNLEDETAVTHIAQTMQLEIASGAGYDDGRQYTVLLDGRDSTWEIRTPAVDANVSLVSSYLPVRQEMVRQQRAIGGKGGVVMVGRDIGTVVMPNAPLKLYITATAAERARRRLNDRQRQGQSGDYDHILADIIRRDEYDGSRTHSPMLPAADALILDSSDKPAATLVADILAILESLSASQPVS